MSLLQQKEKLFYGWIILLIVFIINAVITGISFSFGVFFKSIETAFDLSRATTSSILSASMISGCVFAILGGWALDRYGPKIVAFSMGLFTGLSLLLTSQANAAWQLFITYSLLLGIGVGPVYVATMPVVMKWFFRKRGLAVGLAGSGVGLGEVVMAPLAAFLISKFDWRVAYVTMGSIAWLLLLPIAWFLKGEPREIGALPDGIKAESMSISSLGPEIGTENLKSSSLSLLQAIRTRSFWLVIFIWFFFAICMMLAMTHVVPYATDIGFTATQAAVILSLVGVTTIIGTPVMGVACDRIGRKKTAVICSLLVAGAMLWLIWAHQLWMLYVFAILFGFGSGGLMPSSTALIGDTFGLSSLGKILGMLDIGWYVGAAVGPILGGYIFDISNSYSLAFLLSAIAMVLTALFLALVRKEMEAPKG